MVRPRDCIRPKGGVPPRGRAGAARSRSSHQPTPSQRSLNTGERPHNRSGRGASALVDPGLLVWIPVLLCLLLGDVAIALCACRALVRLS